jgi:hypothetical protein
MVLKEHEESRLLRHKEAIDQYSEQISSYKWEMDNPDITEETRNEIRACLVDVEQNLKAETIKMKAFTTDVMNRNNISAFDKFADLVLKGLDEVEKIINRLPDDIRRPIAAILEKVRAAIEFLKVIF